MKKLLAVAVLSALGLSVSAVQAAGFNHRDAGFHAAARHGEYRHGHHMRHHRFHNRFHHRFHGRGYR